MSRDLVPGSRRSLSPGRWLAALGVTGGAFGALDAAWLGTVAKQK